MTVCNVFKYSEWLPACAGGDKAKGYCKTRHRAYNWTWWSNQNETKGRGILWLLVVFVAHPFRFESHGNLGQSCDIRDSYAGTTAIGLDAF